MEVDWGGDEGQQVIEVDPEDDVMPDPPAEDATPAAEEPTRETKEAATTQEPIPQVAEGAEDPTVAEILRTVVDHGSVYVPQDPDVASHNVAPGEIARIGGFRTEVALPNFR